MNPSDLSAVRDHLRVLAEEMSKTPGLDSKMVYDLRVAVYSSPHDEAAIAGSGFSEYSGKFMLETGRTVEEAMQKLREKLALEKLPQTIPA